MKRIELIEKERVAEIHMITAEKMVVEDERIAKEDPIAEGIPIPNHPSLSQLSSLGNVDSVLEYISPENTSSSQYYHNKENYIPFSQRGKPFDSSLHMLHYVRHCWNQLGFSNKDVTRMLHTFFHPSFEREKCVARTLPEIKKLEAKLMAKSRVGKRR